jgi:predicted tellurium resistance membrane protein TerC
LSGSVRWLPLDAKRPLDARAGMMGRFRYLRVSLALALMIVGIKMLAAKRLKAALGEHFNLYLLAVVFLILAAGVAASLIADRRGRTPSVGR